MVFPEPPALNVTVDKPAVNTPELVQLPVTVMKLLPAVILPPFIVKLPPTAIAAEALVKLVAPRVFVKLPVKVISLWKSAVAQFVINRLVPLVIASDTTRAPSSSMVNVTPLLPAFIVVNEASLVVAATSVVYMTLAVCVMPVAKLIEEAVILAPILLRPTPS